MQLVLITFIRIYRYFFSFCLGNCCRFHPSCSQYGIEAIHQFGCLKGCFLIFKRLLKCHPWHAGGYDPVINLNSQKHYSTHHRS